ncbi:response regulator [Robiginitalea sp. M366]|uniref:response regulator n=1 Tax=Robiginitalea aestuariiviva TaxID=3036903 RepID=UPI00240E3FD8|nr:response regulator [Robiginitalea aestuariiviva]MDG1571151.1 response regulator [Robiginitalea aestuariiviva]
MKTIILIDDDDLGVYLNSMILKEALGTVEIVHYPSVEAALEYFLGPDYSHPNLILLDINLPAMDAWDFLQELEQRQVAIGELPLVLLSSHISPRDEEKIAQYGMEGAVMIKPLQMEILAELGILRH